MGIGRFFLEDWPWDGIKRNTFYELMAPNEYGVSIGIETDLNLEGILRECAPRKDVCMITDSVVAQFSDLVHQCVFSTPQPTSAFRFFFVLLRNGESDSVLMRECIYGESPHGLDWSSVAIPLIVRFRLSGRMYRVDTICCTDAGATQLMVDQFSRDSSPTKMTLASFYKSKYGVEVSSHCPVLVGCLGPCIRSAPIVPDDTVNESHAKTSNSGSTLHLASEFCDRHPFSDMMHLLALVPRRLFWVETGLIAQQVVELLFGSVHEETDLVFDRIFPSAIVSLTATALTCPSAQVCDTNYEKLEWLGDSVWRMVCADEIPDNMKTHYNTFMSNEYIGACAADKIPFLVDRCILSGKPSLKSPQKARAPLKNHRILADIVEALLAVGYFFGGVVMATHAARKMGLLRFSVNGSENMMTAVSIPVKENRRRMDVSMEIFRDCFGRMEVSVGYMHNERKRILKEPEYSN